MLKYILYNTFFNIPGHRAQQQQRACRGWLNFIPGIYCPRRHIESKLWSHVCLLLIRNSHACRNEPWKQMKITCIERVAMLYGNLQLVTLVIMLARFFWKRKRGGCTYRHRGTYSIVSYDINSDKLSPILHSA